MNELIRLSPVKQRSDLFVRDLDFPKLNVSAVVDQCLVIETDLMIRQNRSHQAAAQSQVVFFHILFVMMMRDCAVIPAFSRMSKENYLLDGESVAGKHDLFGQRLAPAWGFPGIGEWRRTSAGFGEEKLSLLEVENLIGECICRFFKPGVEAGDDQYPWPRVVDERKRFLKLHAILSTFVVKDLLNLLLCRFLPKNRNMTILR